MKKDTSVIVWVERGGLICLLIAIFYTIFVYWHRPEPEQPLPLVPVTAIAETGPVAAEGALPEGQEKFDPVRDVFSPFVDETRQDALTGGRARLPLPFKVVGVVLGSEPQVIVEDVALRKTYFVSKGRDDGGFALGRVENNRVELIYQERTYTISVGDNDGF